MSNFATTTIAGVTFSVIRERVDVHHRTYWSWALLADNQGLLDSGTDLSTSAMRPAPRDALLDLIDFAYAAVDPDSGYDGNAFSAPALEALRAIAHDLELATLESANTPW